MKIFFAYIALSLMTITSAVCAQETSLKRVGKVVQVNVAAGFTPKQAVGIILSPKGVSEHEAINISKVRDGLYVVTMSYDSDNAVAESFASAMLRSEEGELAFGDVRRLDVPGSKESFYSLPLCEPPAQQFKIDESKFGVFETLVEHRTARRDFEKIGVTQALDGPLLAQLQKLEDGFGLSRGTPLSPRLHPNELIDRLSRLLTAIKDYKTLNPPAAEQQ